MVFRGAETALTGYVYTRLFLACLVFFENGVTEYLHPILPTILLVIIRFPGWNLVAVLPFAAEGNSEKMRRRCPKTRQEQIPKRP